MCVFLLVQPTACAIRRKLKLAQGRGWQVWGQKEKARLLSLVITTRLGWYSFKMKLLSSTVALLYVFADLSSHRPNSEGTQLRCL